MFYGWVVWAVLTLGLTTVFLGASSGVTFVVEPMKEEMRLTQTSVAMAYTLGTVFSALAQIPMGRSVDRWGGRIGVTVYSAAYFASVACLSLPHSWLMLAVSFGLIRALGVGGFETACNTCLQQWFSRRRGLATGLSQSINAVLSYAVLSNVDASLVRTYGFRTTYASAGMILLVAYTPLAAIFIRSKPEDFGLLPDGDGAPSPPPPPRRGTRQAALQPASEAALQPASDAAPQHANGSAPQPASEPAAEEPGDGSLTLAEAARTRTLVLLASGNALAWGVGSGLFFNLSSIVQEGGLHESQLAPCLYVPWAICRWMAKGSHSARTCSASVHSAHCRACASFSHVHCACIQVVGDAHVRLPPRPVRSRPPSPSSPPKPRSAHMLSLTCASDSLVLQPPPAVPPMRRANARLVWHPHPRSPVGSAHPHPRRPLRSPARIWQRDDLLGLPRGPGHLLRSAARWRHRRPLVDAQCGLDGYWAAPRRRLPRCLWLVHSVCPRDCAVHRRLCGAVA